MIHILNGDSLTKPFLETGLGYNYLVWREILSDGPVLPDLNETLEIREEFIKSQLLVENANYENIVLSTHKQIVSLDEEVTLWFEHDLVCQINLLYLLATFKQIQFSKKIYLVSANNHPAVKNFKSLTQLNGQQLAELYQSKELMNEADLVIAEAMFYKYASFNAIELNDMVNSEFFSLKYLRPALVAHLQRFPNSEHGLNKTEHRILRFIDIGIIDRKKLMRVILDSDLILGLTDLMFSFYMRRLGDLISGHEKISLTERGERVLAGQEKYNALSPMALGGANSNDYEWNDTTKRLREK